MLTLYKGIDDQNEVDKCEEDDVKFLKPGEDAAKAFQSAKKPLYFIAFLIQFAVVFPGIDPVGLS
jgi:hypothetical protein